MQVVNVRTQLYSVLAVMMVVHSTLNISIFLSYWYLSSLLSSCFKAWSCTSSLLSYSFTTWSSNHSLQLTISKGGQHVAQNCSTSIFLSGRQNPQNSRFVSFKGDLLEYGLVHKITFIFSVSAKTAVTGKLRLGLCWEFIFRNIE